MFTDALCVIVTQLTLGFPHPFLRGDLLNPSLNMQGAERRRRNLIWKVSLC